MDLLILKLERVGSPIGRYSVESDIRYVTKQINDYVSYRSIIYWRNP